MEQQKFSSWDVPLFISNPLYQLVSILLILKMCVNKRSKSASIGRIQLYLWGLASKDNIEELKSIRLGKSIEDVPLYIDPQIYEVVRQCVTDGLIVVGNDKDNSLYYLAKRGSQMLDTLSRTDLYKDICQSLEAIGVIHETKIKNLKINWYAAI